MVVVKVLSWTHYYYFGPSLGAVASSALATEYIDSLIEPIKVIVPEWYNELWPLFISEYKINPWLLESGDSVQKMGEHLSAYGHPRFGWLESLVKYAGFIDHEMQPFTPKISLPCAKDSKTALIYPREHWNSNETYTVGYWIRLCNLLINRGYRIIAVLHRAVSHRDGVESAKWCNQLIENIKFEDVLDSTIPTLCEGIRRCSHSIGTMVGPSWICLKSDINQIVLSSHDDEPNETTRAECNLKYFTKLVTCIVGTQLDWINDL